MSDDDMIRRGDALERLELAEHDAEERDWRSGANEIARLRKYVAAIPAVEVGVKPLPHGSAELDAALSDYTPGIDRAVRFVSIDQVDMLAEFYLQNRSALTVQPSPDVVEIDLRAVMMEEIEKAAGQSPWVPPEYTMNEIVSDCCSFLREPREPSPDVEALREALEWYADKDNYDHVYERMPCDCCTDIFKPVERDEGEIARAALARLKGGA